MKALVVEGANPAPVASVLRALQVAEAHIKAAAQVHLDDGRFNQHLRQDHIQLRDDVLDLLHIRARGEDKERIGPLVGDDLGLADHLDFAGGGGCAVDDALEALREGAAGSGRVGAGERGATRRHRHPRQGVARHAGSAHGTAGARRTAAAGTPATRTAGATAEAVQRPRYLGRLRVLDRDDLLHELGRHRHVNLADHFQHPLHVFRVVPQHQHLVGIQGQDCVGNLHEGGQRRHHLAGLDIG